MISIRTHNVADYTVGAIFLISPFIFGFSKTFFAHDVFTVLGLGIIGYSLLTDYRWSPVKAIPMGMHQTFDVVTGSFAILAPWIYGYRDLLTPAQFVLHWVLGLATISLVAFTERQHVKPALEVASPIGPAEITRPQSRPKRAA